MRLSNRRNILWTTNGFTLTELIVVILIIVILATVGFISIQNYNGSARDSNRVADISNISKVLDISNITNGYYPSPDNLFTVAYSWGAVWYQGTVGSWVVRKSSGAGKLSDKPIDPLKKIEYTYSILAYGKAFQLKTDYEGDVLGYLNEIPSDDRNLTTPEGSSNSLIPTVFASTGNPQVAYIKGNFAGLTAKTVTWATVCVLPIPSIITSTGSLGAVLELSANTLSGTLLFNSKPLSGASSFNPNTPISCNGSLPADTVLIAGLQTAYSGSDIVTLPNIQPIVGTQTGQALIGQAIIKNQLGGWIAPVTFGDCTATSFSGYTIPALIHGQTQTIHKAGSISNGSLDYLLPTTCTNTILSYWTEGITVNCNTDYVPAAGNACAADVCWGTVPTNATSTATSQTLAQNWTRSTSAGVCTFDCNTHYTWNAVTSTCDLSTQTGVCSTLSGNKAYSNNSADYSFTQTWNVGSSTYLPATTQSYSASPSANTCQFQCQSGYHTEDGGLTCVSNSRSGQSCTGLPSNGSWNTVSSISQNWNGSAWIPSTVGSYSTTASNTNCIFQCNSGYAWNSGTSACVINPPAAPASSSASPGQYNVTWNWQTAATSSSYEFSNNNSTWANKGNVLSFNESSLSCGTAYTRYVHACNAGGCSSSTNLSATTTPCPIDCTYTTTGWSSCSASCGGGTQSYYYSVTSSAQYGGSCPVSNGQVAGTQSCNTQSCCTPNASYGACTGGTCWPSTPTVSGTQAVYNSCGQYQGTQSCTIACSYGDIGGGSCSPYQCVVNGVDYGYGCGGSGVCPSSWSFYGTGGSGGCIGGGSKVGGGTSFSCMGYY